MFDKLAQAVPEFAKVIGKSVAVPVPRLLARALEAEAAAGQAWRDQYLAAVNLLNASYRNQELNALSLASAMRDVPSERAFADAAARVTENAKRMHEALSLFGAGAPARAARAAHLSKGEGGSKK